MTPPTTPPSPAALGGAWVVPLDGDRRDPGAADAAAAVPCDGGFDTFVRERGRRLARFAFLLTGDVHIAEDLVQTALARLAPRWERVAARGEPTAYVRKTMVHTAVGWRRRRWTGETPVAPLPEPNAVDHAELPDAHLDRREQLRAALLALPPRQRATVVLRFYEDQTEAEVARLLGCSVGTVKSQTAKALARLRALIPADELGGPL